MKSIFVVAVLAFCALADSGVFTPAELPCSYSADIIIEMTDKKVTGTFYTADNLISVIGTAAPAASPMTVDVMLTYRPDVLADGKPVNAQVMKDPMNTCSEDVTFNLANTKTWLSFSFPYESVEKGKKWNGIDCDLYRYDASFSVCATSKENRIVGINASVALLTFSNYVMDMDDMTVFAVNKSIPGCTHTGVYEVPEADPCLAYSSYSSGQSSSSSSKGAASAINAFASIVLAMVMGVLLMVF